MSNRSAAVLLLLQQSFLAVTAAFWLNKICAIVPAPYLDEVFHIRQAQAYLKDQWQIWDPKITTPPGLYLVSYVQNLSLKAFGIHISGSPLVLRSTNVIFGGLLLPVLVREILLFITKAPDSPKKGQATSPAYPAGAVRLGHAALNICLFPPLFFFYGLYYTDVLSAVSVLCAYHCYLKKEYVKVIFAGLASLLFRQTNVFWVAVFLGGLELVRTLPRGRPDVEFPRRVTYHDVILGSWKHFCVYDPSISEAYIEDYFKTIVSLAIAGLAKVFNDPILMFWNLSSYVLVLLAFGEFVLWNGGVVLGDKENHIASIHLAQMLYIWPYFLFFSIPLLAPYLLNALIPQNVLPRLIQQGSLRIFLPRFIVVIPFAAAMLAIVHYNTIVHPFTLADNRHYMFYVFRILLRQPSIKYLAVPIYLVSGWVCLIALGVSASSSKNQQTVRIKIPRESPKREQSTSSLNTSPKQRVTFLVIWLISTTLSLSSAPLVEPRYLILPWLIWRLHVTPAMSTPENSETATPSKQVANPKTAQTMAGINSDERLRFDDLLLWLETAWFLLINLVTGYIFLYWGFEWPQEPGKTQRFMW